MAAAFAFHEPLARETPVRRYSSEQLRLGALPMARTGSSSSTRSEPGYLTTLTPADRARRASATIQTTTKPPSGFGKLFGKKDKKEKKNNDQIILTSIHAAAVKTKMALDSKSKSTRKEPVPAEHSQHVSARQLEMRHPHSGPPALHAPREKAELPLLTRIVSGDEADNADEWERMREDWRLRRLPDIDLGTIEGEVEGQRSGSSTPGERHLSEVEIPPTEIVERQGVRMLVVAGVGSKDVRPQPVRRHTPIGGRYHKDEKGTWKR